MAENEIERIKCYQCTMTFRRESSASPPGGHGRERLICPECRRPFWSAMTAKAHAMVGVDPAHLVQGQWVPLP